MASVPQTDRKRRVEALRALAADETGSRAVNLHHSLFDLTDPSWLDTAATTQTAAGIYFALADRLRDLDGGGLPPHEVESRELCARDVAALLWRLVHHRLARPAEGVEVDPVTTPARSVVAPAATIDPPATNAENRLAVAIAAVVDYVGRIVLGDGDALYVADKAPDLIHAVQAVHRLAFNDMGKPCPIRMPVVLALVADMTRELPAGHLLFPAGGGS